MNHLNFDKVMTIICDLMKFSVFRFSRVCYIYWIVEQETQEMQVQESAGNMCHLATRPENYCGAK